MWLLLACAACAQPLPEPRPIVSVEGGADVVDVRAMKAPYDTVLRDHVPLLRRMPGNHAVYVVRGDGDVVWVISIWETEQTLEQCDEAGLCSGRAQMLRVLYEMTQ